ncbi:MAG: hypothetical protein HY259_06665 [Chloroflexi bacterium]|nr:hypothetical protein [Chloroflexota bacterium]
MPEKLVLTEDEALELLSFLVMAARTMVGEPNEYAPLRLLTAAGRLSDFIVERVTPETRVLLSGPLKQIPQTATRMADADGYAKQLDAVCAAVAQHLVRHFGLERGIR